MFLYIFQQFAELEEHTPGTIHGIDYDKKHGNWSSNSSSTSDSEKVDPKHTQKGDDFENFKKQDISGTHEEKVQKDPLNNVWYWIGFGIFLVCAVMLFQEGEKRELQYEQERALERQKSKKERPFDEA